MNSCLVILKIFTPTTALITTSIAEFGFALSQFIYAKKKLNLNIRILTKQNVSYLILCILFIPISYIIRLANLNFWINLLLITITCVLFYFGILYIKKDDNLLLAINKLFKKINIRRRKYE